MSRDKQRRGGWSGRSRAWPRAVNAGAAFLVGLLAFVSGCSKRAPATSPTPAVFKQVLTAEQRRKNVESFDEMWTIIRDRHFDPKLNGVDWDAVRAKYRPVVVEATTMSEARSAMNDAIETLGQSHFGIIAADAYEAMSDPSGEGATSADGEGPTPANREGTTGVEGVVLDGKLVVRRVIAGSPADRAGVRVGWLVRSVRGKPVEPVLARVRNEFADKSYRAVAEQRAADAMLRGPVGKSLALEVLNGRDVPLSLELPLVSRDERKAAFGHLPPMPLRLESRRLEGNVGYILLTLWMDPAYVIPEIRKAIESFADTRGIIIDLRGNPGGLGAMAMGVGNYFITDSQHKLGTMILRDTQLSFVLSPQPTAYTGPLAILVDELSMSTSEIFAGGMKDIGRARVFGTPTPGAALPSVVVRLPNGDALQYAFANYISSGGATLEGAGVKPDEIVTLDRAGLLAGRDAVIDAAVKWITAQNPTTGPASREAGPASK